MSALREVFAYLGFEYDKSKLNEANKSVDSLITSLKGAASAAVGGVIVDWLGNIAQELDVFDDLSAATKVSVTDLQALAVGFEVNGSSAEEMRMALFKLNSDLGKMAAGAKGVNGALEHIGIKKVAGQVPTLGEALPQIFDGFAKITDDAKAAQYAQELFGRAGVKLLPVLRQGAGGLEGMRAALAEIGGGATTAATTAASDYRDSLTRLHFAFFSLKGLIATAVFPRLAQVTNEAAKAVGSFSAWAKETTGVDSAVKILSVSLAVKLATALAPYLKPGLKFAAIFIAIDEVLAFLAGKDSYIADLLNAAFGEGSADVVRTWVNDAIYEFERFRDSASETFAAIDDENASAWVRAEAALVGFVRDASQGFPVFRASVSEIMAGVENDFAQALLGMAEAYNKFLTTVLGSGSKIAAALSIDTSTLSDHLSATQNDLAAARERTDAARLGGSPRVDPNAPVRQAFTGLQNPATGSNAAPGILLEAAHGRPEAQVNFGPYRQGLAPSFSIAQTAPVNIYLPAGTPVEVARNIGRAAQNGIREANRSARQAITQKGG